MTISLSPSALAAYRAALGDTGQGIPFDAISLWLDAGVAWCSLNQAGEPLFTFSLATGDVLTIGALHGFLHGELVPAT